MASFGERQEALRAALDRMGYVQGFDSGSAHLIEQLVLDLRSQEDTIRYVFLIVFSTSIAFLTTYHPILTEFLLLRSLQAENARLYEESQECHVRATTLQAAHSRLAREVNGLHSAVIAAKEESINELTDAKAR
jgi:hypothetical protein